MIFESDLGFTWINHQRSKEHEYDFDSETLNLNESDFDFDSELLNLNRFDFDFNSEILNLNEFDFDFDPEIDNQISTCAANFFWLAPTNLSWRPCQRIHMMSKHTIMAVEPSNGSRSVAVLSNAVSCCLQEF